MKDKKLLISFIGTVLVALFLRFFAVDFISVSNDILQPDFYPGDFVLISRVFAPEEGQWALLKDYPKKSFYSIRRLAKKESDQGWKVVEPSIGNALVGREEFILISEKQIIGKAVVVLWSFPCKPSIVANGLCPEKGSRLFKRVSN
jgi:hypothetical protein